MNMLQSLNSTLNNKGKTPMLRPKAGTADARGEKKAHTYEIRYNDNNNKNRQLGSIRVFVRLSNLFTTKLYLLCIHVHPFYNVLCFSIVSRISFSLSLACGWQGYNCFLQHCSRFFIHNVTSFCALIFIFHPLFPPFFPFLFVSFYRAFHLSFISSFWVLCLLSLCLLQVFLLLLLLLSLAYGLILDSFLFKLLLDFLFFSSSLLSIFSFLCIFFGVFYIIHPSLFIHSQHIYFDACHRIPEHNLISIPTVVNATTTTTKYKKKGCI